MAFSNQEDLLDDEGNVLAGGSAEALEGVESVKNGDRSAISAAERGKREASKVKTVTAYQSP
jgi:hypothetical protein